ncbi:ubiquitin carboxyl-terminal hydrolase 36-like isoform X2 [Thrips palmi]|uniref:Ubiquitin carboxyl-terminal hydrolase 36 n=1 Tax=Thrips palmi TaxID=161013 RepID=A0A6P8ZRF2_THRPL|nr:ubiquitin carboxyl-terminal hydrolase 36-like isoform X2 [Thrips palmi]
MSGTFLPYTCRKVNECSSQNNSHDCGVFLCYFARQIVIESSISHSSAAVSRLRHQMAFELLSSQLMDDNYLLVHSFLELLMYFFAHKTYIKFRPFHVSQDEYYPNGPLMGPTQVLYTALPAQQCPMIVPGSGLRNLGNTCYINSCVQMLMHIGPFAAFLEEDEDHRLTCLQEKCLTCALGKLRSDCQKGAGVVEPVELIMAIKDFWKDFEDGRMEDATEFLNLMLPRLQQEYIERFFLEDIDIHSQKTTPVCQIFGFYIRTETKCTSCQLTSVTFDHTLQITYPVARIKSVKNGLDLAMAPVEVADYNCNGCFKSVTANTVMTMQTLPRVLIIYQQRFVVGKLSKDTDPV